MKRYYRSKSLVFLLVFSLLLSIFPGFSEQRVIASSCSEERNYGHEDDVMRKDTVVQDATQSHDGNLADELALTEAPIDSVKSDVVSQDMAADREGTSVFTAEQERTNPLSETGSTITGTQEEAPTTREAEQTDQMNVELQVEQAGQKVLNNSEEAIITDTFATETGQIDQPFVETPANLPVKTLKNPVKQSVKSLLQNMLPDLLPTNTGNEQKEVPDPPSTEEVPDSNGDADISNENEENLLLLHKEAEDDVLDYILAEREWSKGHFIWYVKKNNSDKHYLFCLEKGKIMRSNLFLPTRRTGTFESPFFTFRTSLAFSYFLAHGGISSVQGYEDTQYAIWNEGQTTESSNLLTYTQSLWKLTELNSERAAESSSFSDKLTPVREEDMQKKAKRAAAEIHICRLKDYSEGKGYDLEGSIPLQGSAWKYFAAGGKGEWDGSSAGKYGSISVSGCYASDGSALSDNEIHAEIHKDGMLSIQMNQKNADGNAIATGRDNAILIVMKVEHSYSGSNTIGYLDCGRGTQNLLYDASGTSPAYFAVKVYARTGVQNAALTVQKIDEFGKPVDGAEFALTGKNQTGDVLAGFPMTLNASEPSCVLTEEGTYHLEETKAPAGMQKLFGRIADLQAEKRLENKEQKLYLFPKDKASQVVCETTDNGLSYTYTVQNAYLDGSAYLRKLGHVFIAYENGKFLYQDRPLNGIPFSLYAGEDIYAGQTLLFSNGQQLTQEVLDQSVWNTVGHHEAHVDLVTDMEGKMNFDHMPPGHYYVIEGQQPYPGYGVSGSRLYFDVIAEQTVQIQNGPYYNQPVTAGCMAIKVDSENEAVRLSGAEFTLYAHIENVNFDGNPLFQVEDTRPVTIGESGAYRVEENTWIPIDTETSDENGQAYFDLQLPYGTYLVAETQAPEGYGLSKDTYQFEHRYDAATDWSSGVLFTHTFGNKKKSNMIIIHKTGELLADAREVSDTYGSFQQLRTEMYGIGNVEFEISDAAGAVIETLKTDENGIAASSNLKPGIYYVRELSNGGILKLDSTVKEVTLKEDQTVTTQSEVVDFINEAPTVSCRIYKQGETCRFAKQADQVSTADDLFEYTLKPLSDVVFAICTKNPIYNVNHQMIVAADACLGYCVTDQNGIAVFQEKISSGDYYFKEIRTADDSLEGSDQIHPFHIDVKGEDLLLDINRENPVTNSKYKGSIRVIKTNGDETVRLSGVKFTLFDSDKTNLGSFITDANGEISVQKLPLGTYYLQETETLQTYVLDGTLHQIDLTKEAMDRTLSIRNQQEKKRITTEEKKTTEQKKITEQKQTTEEKQKKTRVKGIVHTGDGSKTGGCMALLGIFSVLLCLLVILRKGGLSHADQK